MDWTGTARRLRVVLLLLGGSAAGAQMSLPAISPTALPPSPPTQMSQTAAPQAAGRARVEFADGKLEVTADNSSLNQILREISRQTGMKITGGVADERVFGKYGPGPMADILESLLDGTGSNMVLVEPASKGAPELILTARQGGPTPPNPNAASLDDEARPDREEPERRPPFEETPVARSPAPPAEAAVGGTGAAATNLPEANGGAAGSTGAANPTSPNGVETPQQIFEQLQRMQSAKPQQ